MPFSRNPAQDVVAYLAAQGLGLTSGVNLFIGELRGADANVPGQAVFVLNTAGSAPTAHLGTGKAIWTGGLDIFIRGAPNSFQTGEALARSVTSALIYAIPAGYIAVMSSMSAPEYMGEDGTGRPQWLLKGIAMFEQ